MFLIMVSGMSTIEGLLTQKSNTAGTKNIYNEKDDSEASFANHARFTPLTNCG